MMHKNQTNQECSKCRKLLDTQKRLNEHLKQHTSSQQLMKCPHCSECYKNKLALNIHIGMMHKTKIKPFNPNFNFTTAVKFPTWQEIKTHRHRNAHYNAAGFLKMIGRNVEDPRNQLKDIAFTVNEQKLLDDWKENMSHDVSFGICATCGRQLIKTEGEYQIISMTNKLLQCCKVEKSKLLDKNSIKYKSLHLVKAENGDIFRLCDEGINGDQVTICKVCSANLVYASKTKKPPIHTFAHYDLGKMPKLPKLTFGEKLAISKVIVFVPQIQLKPVYGKSNKGIKGHAFGIKASQEDILSSLVNMLPRHDLGDVVQISFCGNKEMWPLAKEILKQGDLHIRMDVIMLWLGWFKAVKNPEFHDVTIPSSDREKARATQMLEASVKKILDNAFQSSSARIARLNDHVRAEVIDEEEGLNDDMDAKASLIRNTLITEETHSEEPMHSVLQQIKHKLSEWKHDDDQEQKIEKTLHAELINEYTANHRLLSAAFPHVFPLGLPERAMGTATVPKLMLETWMLFHDHRCAEEMHLMFFVV